MRAALNLHKKKEQTVSVEQRALKINFIDLDVQLEDAYSTLTTAEHNMKLITRRILTI